MLLNLIELNNKYNLNIKGVLHIGAHHGQEDSVYSTLGIENVIYFEPLVKSFNILKNRVPSNRILHNIALGNDEKMVDMNVEENNQMMSSSILEPKLHLTQYPHIIFNKKEKVKMMKLDSIEFNKNNFNMINIDVQGYELEVFKGSSDSLNYIDYIMTEVNRDEVYENCVKIEELDKHLSSYGFERVETTWDGGTWGDAFYIKKR
jgi:FkbM family methyltransferase